MNYLLIIGGLGMQELMLVLVILLLLFGSTKLPQLAKGLGQSIKEFKKGAAEGNNEAQIEETRRESLTSGQRPIADETFASSNLTANKTR